MWNHIVKNFQVKHGQCDSTISHETYAFEGSKLLLDLCLADSRTFYFWCDPESTNKFIIELHALQCLFVSGSNKKQIRGKIISNFTRRDFFISYDNQVLLGVISQCGPVLGPSKKNLPLLFSLAKKRIYLDTQLKAELTNLFWKLPGCSVFSRVGIRLRTHYPTCKR